MTAVIVLKEAVTCYIYDDNAELLFATDDPNLCKVLSGITLSSIYVVGSYATVLSGEDAVVVGSQVVNNVSVNLFLLKSDLAYIAALVKLTNTKACGFYSLIDFYSKIEPNGVSLDYGSEPDLVRMVISKQGSVVTSVEMPIESAKSSLAESAKLKVCFLKDSDFISPLYQYLVSTEPMLHLNDTGTTFVLNEEHKVDNTLVKEVKDAKLVKDIKTEEAVEDEAKSEPIESGDVEVSEQVIEYKRRLGRKKKKKLKANNRENASSHNSADLMLSVENAKDDFKQATISDIGSVEETLVKNKPERRKSPKKNKVKEPEQEIKPPRKRSKIDLDSELNEVSGIEPTPVREPKSKKPLFVAIIVIISLMLVITAVLAISRLFIAPDRITLVQSEGYKAEASIMQLSPKIDAILESDVWVSQEEFGYIVSALNSINNSVNNVTFNYGEVVAEVFVTDIVEYQSLYSSLLEVVEEDHVTSTLLNDTEVGQVYEIIITRR